MATLGREDHAVADEHLGYRLSLVEETAAIGAHVEDDALEVTADLEPRPVERVVQRIRGAAVEAGEVDQRDIALALVGHGGRDDAAAPHLDRQLLAAAAQHC